MEESTIRHTIESEDITPSDDDETQLTDAIEKKIDDAVHVSDFLHPAGILPHQAGKDIAWEELSVVRMAAKIKVCACLCQLGQLRRLVVNHKNWKRLVQSGKQFGFVTA